MNVYELPTTKEVVRFLHAALGFPTKPTLLTAAQNKNFVTFPSLIVENIANYEGAYEAEQARCEVHKSNCRHANNQANLRGQGQRCVFESVQRNKEISLHQSDL